MAPARNYYLLLILVFLTLTSCPGWKVSDLEKDILIHVKSGTAPEEVSLEFGNNDILRQTFGVRVSNKRVICSDNVQKKILVLNSSGEPELYIGPAAVPLSHANDDPFKFEMFSFGVIGKTVADKAGNIYVQNSILPDEANSPKKSSKLPSYILCFDPEGKILYTLGQDGSPDLPFYNIYSLYTDNNNRLFVTIKNMDNWSIMRFEGKQKDFLATFSKNDFIDRDTTKEQGEYEGRVENILPFISGDRLLLSVAYYDTTRFKYRKIYEYFIDDKKLGRTVLDLPDPKNELFAVMEDSYMVLWDVDREDIRFSIWSMQENVVNNLRIKLTSPRPYYEDVLIDESGRFYSLVVKRQLIEIKSWK